MKIALRICVLIFTLGASQASLAQDFDCSEPLVTFGEVMAGLQAGFTGGSVNETTLPSGLYLGASGVDQRGFIDPESGSGWKCHGDWGLVSAWLGISLGGVAGTVTTWQEARELAENLFRVTIEVDGVQHEPVQAAVRIGTLPPPDDAKAAIKSWGAFSEPYSLAVGLHTATIIFEIDFDCLPPILGGAGICDGIFDFVFFEESTDFEVVPN